MPSTSTHPPVLARTRARSLVTATVVVAMSSAALVVAAAPAGATVTPAPIGPETVMATGYGDGGPASQARLDDYHIDLAPLPGGGLVFTDGSNEVRKVKDGVVTCIAGCAHKDGFSGDGGAAVAATFSGVISPAVAPDGTVYVADRGNARIRRISTAGIVTTVAGTGHATTFVPGGVATTLDVSPSRLALGPDGSLYFVDDVHGRTVRKLTGTTLSLVAGDGGFSSGWNPAWEGGAATSATLGNSDTTYLAVGPTGTVYISDATYKAVLSVSAGGTIHYFASTGSYVSGVTAAADGTVDVLDDAGVHHIATNGTMTVTLTHVPAYGALVEAGGVTYTAGSYYAWKPGTSVGAGGAIWATTAADVQSLVVGGSYGRVGDGQDVSQASFDSGAGTLTLADGTIYVAERSGFIRRIGTDHKVSTVAGAAQFPAAFSGEGGAASAASIPSPGQLARDAAGNIFVACGDGTVREILASDSTIHTVAGSGTVWSSTPPAGPVAATSMQFDVIRQISVAPDGTLYVVDGTADDQTDDRVVAVRAGTATQITGTSASATGSAAIGQPISSVGPVRGAAVSPTGVLHLLDAQQHDFLSTDGVTVTSALETIYGPFDRVLFDPAGNVVRTGGVVQRSYADGSADNLLGTPGWPWDTAGISVSGSAVTWWDGGIHQKTLPAVVARPAAPTGVIVPEPHGVELALHVTSAFTPNYIDVEVYEGTQVAPGAALDAKVVPTTGDLGYFEVTPAYLTIPNGTTVTVFARVFDTSHSVWSPMTQWTFVMREGVKCSFTPVNRVVPAGSVVPFTLTTGVYGGFTQFPVSGTLSIARSGLATTSSPLTTSAAGTATGDVAAPRTTTVSFSAPATATTTACTGSVVYSVVGSLSLKPRTTSARHYTLLPMTAALSPRISGQRVYLQQLSGKKWVSVAKGLTSSKGVVGWSLRLPKKAGSYYYRVASSTSAALVGGVSRSVRIRVS